jgi:DNA-binding HxlR family transcriptional regulator
VVLLVIRDLLHGKRTYGEIAKSPEGIPTNILADRLARLEQVGIIESAAYQERPVRYAYTLTPKGRDLGDVVLALVRWGKKHIPGTRTLTEEITIVTRSSRLFRERVPDSQRQRGRVRVRHV